MILHGRLLLHPLLVPSAFLKQGYLVKIVKMSTGDFQTKYAAVMKTLMQTAIAETTIIFESIVGELKAEISRIKTENQHLKLKCSQSERDRSLFNFNIEDRQKLLERSDNEFEKRHIVQSGKLLFILYFIASAGVNRQLRRRAD